MTGALRQFWSKPFFDKLNTLSTAYYFMKGVLLYRLVFRRFGYGSLIRRPTLISNPRFIAIGDRVTIRDGVRLEAIQTNPARAPELAIGSGTNIEQNVHIVCHSRVHVGENVSITGHCAIVDVTHPHEDVHDSRKIGDRILDEQSYVEIGSGSFLGFGTVVLPNVRIGRFAIIAAHSVIVDDIPDYSVAAGAPARVIKRFAPETGTWVSVPSDRFSGSI